MRTSKPHYNSYASAKVPFANKIIKSMNKENIDILDLKEQINKIAKAIEVWNKGV